MYGYQSDDILNKIHNLSRESIKCKLLLIHFIFSLTYSLSKISLLLIEFDTTHDSGFLTSTTEVLGRYPKYSPYACTWIYTDGL